MRSEGLSLTRAAREASTTPQTVRKHVTSAVRRGPGGRYQATPSDRLTRRLWLLTEDGKVEVAVRGSRTASQVAAHMAAVDRFLRTGELEPLEPFRDQGVRAGGVAYAFVTDPEVLERLAQAGEVSFERLYTRRG